MPVKSFTTVVQAIVTTSSSSGKPTHNIYAKFVCIIDCFYVLFKNKLPVSIRLQGKGRPSPLSRGASSFFLIAL